MAVVANPLKERTVRRLRIQIGAEWIEHNFGRDVPMFLARERALQIVEALTGEVDG